MHADALGVFLGHDDAAVAEGLDGGGHAELDEAIHAPRFLLGDTEVRDLEALDLAGEGGRVGAGIETRNRADAAAAGHDRGPIGGHADTDRR